MFKNKLTRFFRWIPCKWLVIENGRCERTIDRVYALRGYVYERKRAIDSRKLMNNSKFMPSNVLWMEMFSNFIDSVMVFYSVFGSDSFNEIRNAIAAFLEMCVTVVCECFLWIFTRQWLFLTESCWNLSGFSLNFPEFTEIYLKIDKISKYFQDF